MIEHAIDLKIDRPVDEVFAFLTNEENHPRWDHSSVSMRPEEPGPWRMGLTFREVRRVGPRRTVFRSKVAALVPNELMDIDSVTGPEFHGHWRFSPDGRGTMLRWSCEMAVEGPGRFAERLVAISFRRACDDNFRRLKDLIEKGPGVRSDR